MAFRRLSHYVNGAIASFFMLFALQANAIPLITVEGDNNFAVTSIDVNGTFLEFIISTGSDQSFLSSSAAALTGITDTGNFFIDAPSFQETASVFSGAFIVGGSEVTTEFVVTDTVPLSPGVSGRIGTSFLLEHNFLFSHDLLTINPDFPITDGPDGEYIIEIPVKGTSGTQTLKFEVDTGASPTTITTTKATALGLTDTGKKVKLGGAGSGTASIFSGTLDDLGLTEFVVTDSVPLVKGSVGVLGRNVLDKRFSWSWDKDGNGTLTINKPAGGTTSSGTTKKTFAVPEPTTVVLFIFGLSVFLITRRTSVSYASHPKIA